MNSNSKKQKLLVYYLYQIQIDNLKTNLKKLLHKKNFKINSSIYHINYINKLFIIYKINTLIKLNELNQESHYLQQLDLLNKKWAHITHLINHKKEIYEPFHSNFSFINSIYDQSIKNKLIQRNSYKKLKQLDNYDLSSNEFNQYIKDYSKLLNFDLKNEIEIDKKFNYLDDYTIHNYLEENKPKKYIKSNLKGLSVEIKGRLKGARRARNYGYTYGTIGSNSFNKRSKMNKEKVFTKWGIWNLKISISRNIDQLHLL